MINQKSVQACRQASSLTGFLKPLYDSYCFSQIPNTILNLLGCGTGGLPKECIESYKSDRVILLLVDGFGWKFVEKYKDRYPFLQRFFEKGIVSKLTSQFPSTTAAHMTTLCSNKLVGDHGIYEWFMYEPIVERVVAPLLFAFAGDKKGGTLERHLAPSEFYPEGHFFKELKKNNVSCTVFQQETIAHSIYSNWMFSGTERVAYRNWPEGVKLLGNHLHSKGFFYIYFGDFDHESHHHGVNSAEVEKAVDRCFQTLESLVIPSSTTVLMTADHGMIDIDPKATIYLNQRFPALEKKLKIGADGRPLTPAGSCRDYFLHVKPPYIMEVFKQLQEGLQGEAWVCLTAELIERGFFGPRGISRECQKRMADIAILPTNGHSIWWYEEGLFEQNLHAMHGGLTPEELEIPFLYQRMY